MLSSSVRKMGITALIAALISSSLGVTTASASGSSGSGSAERAMIQAGGRLLSLTQTAAGGPEGAAGLASSAVLDRLQEPVSLVVLPDGSMAVSDTDNHVIRRIKDGKSSVLAGASLSYGRGETGVLTGGLLDGEGKHAFFNKPAGLAADSSGVLYVADSANHAIRRIGTDGAVTTIAGSGLLGLADGAGDEARFHTPQDVAVDGNGTLYVADTLNHVIRRISKDGEVTTIGAPSARVVEVHAGIVTLAGNYKNGRLQEAEFNEPSGLALDNKGNLFVSDSGNQAIRYIDFQKGTVTTAAGILPSADVYKSKSLYAPPGYTDGSAGAARFHTPKGLTWTAAEGLLIADSGNHVIRQLNHGVVSTIAGNMRGFADGLEHEAAFDHPSDVVQGTDGSLLIADQHNQAVRHWTPYTVPAGAYGRGLQIMYENELMKLGAAPVLIKGQLMLPAAEVGRLLGYAVHFDEKKQTYSFTKGMENKVLIADRAELIPVEPSGQADKTSEAITYVEKDQLLSVRDTAKWLGKDVQWISGAKLILIRDAGNRNMASWHSAYSVPRYMSVTDLNGDVKIRYGGTLIVDAYEGMMLTEGDELITGLAGSAVLQTLDRKDIITLSEQASLYITDLRKTGAAHNTQLKLNAGEAYLDVTPLTKSGDTFVIQSGFTSQQVRGTHFLISTEPATGLSKAIILSGKVSATQTPGGDSQVIYPSQQLHLDPSSKKDNLLPPVEIIDVEKLVERASPAVLEAIIKNKADIERENEALIKQLGNASSGGSDAKTGLNIKNQEELNKLAQNFERLVGNIALQTQASGKINSSDMKKMIEEANRKDPTAKKLELDLVKPLDKKAGIPPTDPAREKQSKESQLALARKLEEQKKAEKEMVDQLQDVMKKLLEQIMKIQQQNMLAEQEMLQKVVKMYMESLSIEEKERFMKEREKAVNGPKQPQAPVTSFPNPVIVSPVQPPVPVNPPAPPTDPPVEPEEPVDPEEPTDPEPPAPAHSVKVVYSNDMSEELEAGEENYFGWVYFETEGLQDDSKVQVRVTLKRNGTALSGLPVLYNDYTIETNAEGQFMLKPLQETGFRLADLKSADNPIQFSASLLEAGTYTETIELVQMQDGEETVILGGDTRTIIVSPGVRFEFMGEEPFLTGTSMYWGFHTQAYGLDPEMQVGYEVTILHAESNIPFGEAELAFQPVVRERAGEANFNDSDPYLTLEPIRTGTFYLEGETLGLGAAGDTDLAGDGHDLNFRLRNVHAGEYDIQIRLVNAGTAPIQYIGEAMMWRIIVELSD
ncbi:stalk domain-containing protein [Paenibacillus lemnae]|uniref:Copper amine oxidase n=1 Tax=Paenibacillus lemnae TaxID=1330551 RepID=A0A848M9F0_PAELE|nr:FecR domain-containing protein [Paenibacillus lemnae]NMO97305.1 copper amine oxidase [Paenibacillus lemnae]